MLAAKPIIHANSAANDLVEIAKAGLSTPAEDPEAVADAVVEVVVVVSDGGGSSLVTVK